MKKILFALCNRIADNSMNVCIRNVKIISDHLKKSGVDVKYASFIVGADKKSASEINGIINDKWDAIISVYSSFYVHKDAVKALVKNNPQAKIGFLTTEYDIGYYDIFGDLDFVISNYTQELFKRPTKQYKMLNLNTLIARERNAPVDKKYDKIYYGRFRPDRSKYFGSVLNDKSIYISTSKKNISKFLAAGAKGTFIDKLSWDFGKETLNLFKKSIYIEDLITHDNYNHLGNRFYESLYCNAMPLFDKTCRNTLIKSGCWYDDRSFNDDMSDDYIERFLDKNTKIALEERSRVLGDLTEFLINV